LEREHPSAAASLREGLEDTLTLLRLGIKGQLHQTLRSTNLIESLNSTVAAFARNIRKWRSGEMLLRWAATALREAEPRMNRIRGFNDLRDLIAILRQHEKAIQMDIKKEVA